VEDAEMGKRVACRAGWCVTRLWLMRSVAFWDITQRIMVIPYRRFRTACRRFQDVRMFLKPRQIVVGLAVAQSFDVGPSSRRLVLIWLLFRQTAREILVESSGVVANLYRCSTPMFTFSAFDGV